MVRLSGPYLVRSFGIDPFMMTKPLLLIAAFALLGSDATAQTPVSEPSSASLQSCLLGTRPETWATLKLTRDQLQRMEHVQEACKEECAGVGARKQASSISNADGSTVMSEVKNILTSDQYRAWVAYCAGSPVSGQAPK